jgi:hypothetical protein
MFMTGRLRKIQLTKIPNQGVTSDVSEAGYPFGQVICSYAWGPSIFDTIRYDLEQDENIKNHVGVLYF